MRIMCLTILLGMSLLAPSISRSGEDGEKPQWTYDPHTLAPEEKPDHQDDPQQANLQEDFSAYWQNIGLGLGTYSPFYDKVQTDNLGDTNGLEFNPMAYVSATVHMARDFAWTPNLAVVFPQNNADDNVHKQTFIMKSDFAYLLDTPIGMWNLGMAPGLFFDRITGGGGTTTLNNGTSTESFYVPDRASVAYNFTLGALVDYFPLPEWSLKTAVDVFAPFTSDERSVSFTLLISWHYLGVQNFWD